MSQDIKALCERALELSEKATPGPWDIEQYDNGEEWWFGGYDRGQVIVNGFVSGGCKHIPEKWNRLVANATLIAEARTLLPTIAKAYLELLEKVK